MTAFAAAPIRKRKLYEQIVDRIETMMLEGRLAPGQQLPSERDLMTTFNVGRTAVREALFALDRMGLINIQNGERAVVTKPTASALLDELAPSIHHMLRMSEGVRQFQDARLFFEVALVRHAAQVASPADIERLEAALNENKRMLGNSAAFIESDIAFHFKIAEMRRNPIFTSLHSAMTGWLKEQRTMSALQPKSDELAYRAHARIFRAIVKHDANAAESAMRKHLAEVSDSYWKAKTGRRDSRPERSASLRRTRSEMRWQ